MPGAANVARRYKLRNINRVIPAFIALSSDGEHQADFGTLQPDDLGPGTVTVDVEYSSVNFKDALAAAADGRVARISPLVPGIDLAGMVAASGDDRFAPGDRILATGYDLGVAHHGGYAARARLPGDWVHVVPDSLTTHDAMALGTAGLTAALCVDRLIANGLNPGSGSVLVTGATGGVGSCAVSILSRLGFPVAAATGKTDAHDWLRKLGAGSIVDRSELAADKPRPLGEQRYAGAVDTVGGTVLANVLPLVSYGGVVAACGNAGGAAVGTTVFPFILRAVTLAGVDSVAASRAVRDDVWRRLASDWKPDLEAIATTVSFSDIPAALERIRAGGMRGRTVVDMRAAS